MPKDEDAPRAVEDVASATECTGLVPALTDAAGEDARRGLYGVQRGKKRRDKR